MLQLNEFNQSWLSKHPQWYLDIHKLNKNQIVVSKKQLQFYSTVKEYEDELDVGRDELLKEKCTIDASSSKKKNTTSLQ